MNVRIGGCVNKQGLLELRDRATIATAIRAAGGLRFDKEFFATGIVSVRRKRKRDGKYYCRRRLNLVRHPEKALTFPLRESDAIVIQFGIRRAEGLASSS